jgi:AmiR/NasT family two-component response regulator
VRNAALYRECRRMTDNLHTALESRATIEQAKGILNAEFGVPPEEAFQLLSRVSQKTNRKVREISEDLVQGRIDREMFRPVQGE